MHPWCAHVKTHLGELIVKCSQPCTCGSGYETAAVLLPGLAINRPNERWRQLPQQNHVTPSAQGRLGLNGGFPWYPPSTTTNKMADALVVLREDDVRGAKLLEKDIEKNSTDVLRRWLECRGLSSTKSESHALLVRRWVGRLSGVFLPPWGTPPVSLVVSAAQGRSAVVFSRDDSEIVWFLKTNQPL